MENHFDQSISPSSSAGSSSPAFPPEVEREIFEIAAACFPNCAVTLIRVAWRIKEWIEPQIYTVLVFSESRGRRFPHLCEGNLGGGTKSPQFKKATKYAKHILIDVASDSAFEILRSSNNVKDLAIAHGDVNFPIFPELIPVVGSLPIERLSADDRLLLSDSAYDLEPPEFNHSIFMHLTHLYARNEDCRWERWKNLARLPKLTHLALSSATNEFLDRILKECQNIEVLVVFYRHDFPEDEADGRIVTLPYLWDRMEDWERGARGQEDFWMKAEKTQAAGLKE